MIKLPKSQGYVFYQFPNEDKIFHLNGNWQKFDINSFLNKEGFVISNFDKSSMFYLEGESTEITTEYELEISSTNSNPTLLTKLEYIEKANQFIKECSSTLSKVILSRVKKIDNLNKLNPFDLFVQLCKEYNHSFNYIVNIPEVGTWLGATPEPLIKGNNNSFSTIALAGSQAISKDITWQEKEIEEHQYVADFIAEKLKLSSTKINRDNHPKTTLAGNVAHLKTNFQISSSKTLLELANILHPTPAISGTPQMEAIEFIKKNEGYNRNFYTGFLGNVSGTGGNLFVNLRCMEFAEKGYYLYVGGGITEKSIPENEWNETELKSNTLLKILSKQ